MKCICCFEMHGEMDSFFKFFQKDKALQRMLCGQCREQLIEIAAVKEKCQYCLNTYELRENICYDCIRWQSTLNYQFNHATLFTYNTFAKSIIWKIKHNGDIALVTLLSGILKDYIYDTYDISVTSFVPMPSDDMTLAKRGIHLSRLILESVGVQVVVAFDNFKWKEKQHKLGRNERLGTAFQEMSLNARELEKLRKQVVIFDDIFTTGATMASAYTALRSIPNIDLKSLSFFR